MVASEMASKYQNSERASLIELMVSRSPAGLMLVEKGRLLLANSAALLALGIDERSIGQTLKIDSADGLLHDRLVEALRTDDATLVYRVPATEFRSERILEFEVVALEDSRLLARVDDCTLRWRAESRWEDSISHAFHELKTPVAVLKLGLSNLATYYDRLSDEDKRAEINDLMDQISQMGDIINDLYQQMKSTSKRNSSPSSVESTAKR
jgi:signal transduction histidine kinase